MLNDRLHVAQYASSPTPNGTCRGIDHPFLSETSVYFFWSNIFVKDALSGIASLVKPQQRVEASSAQLLGTRAQWTNISGDPTLKAWPEMRQKKMMTWPLHTSVRVSAVRHPLSDLKPQQRRSFNDLHEKPIASCVLVDELKNREIRCWEGTGQRPASGDTFVHPLAFAKVF